jgi:S-adenosylmethionine hydrolase
LAAGFSIEEVGPRLDDVVRLSRSSAVCVDGCVRGRVTTIDPNFGNVWTNITRELLERGSLEREDTLNVQIGTHRYQWPLANTFSDVAKGRPLIYFNSRDRLAFGINQGSLAEAIEVARGIDVSITHPRGE